MVHTEGYFFSSGIEREYCNWETFTAQCQPDQVVMITIAKYGRMKLGRCVPLTYDASGDPSVIGCIEDIIRYLISCTDLAREYCNWETFSAHCEPGEVVMMSTAKYGRMRLGRCIPETYDRHGNPSLTNCSEDILRYISDLCLDILREFCNWETFSAACKPGEIVLMTSAKYGRMRFGRCVRKMFDDSGRQAVVGCEEDIIK